MPTAPRSTAPADTFESRLAAALETANPAAPSRNPARPADAEPRDVQAQPATGSVPVIESDDRFFDDLPAAPEEPRPTAPRREPRPPAAGVGSGAYVVQSGDCIASIAAGQGLFWETVWNHPGNADLRAARRDPHVLLPGDRVHVPERRRKEESGATETRHRFRKRGEPCELLITLLDADDNPRAGAPYRLYVAGRSESGTLDADGTLRSRIPAATDRAKLVVGEGPFEEHYHVRLGALDPDEADSGIRARLLNLGYLASAAEDPDDPADGPAVSWFQGRNGLPATGMADEATRARLRDKHQSVGG